MNFWRRIKQSIYTKQTPNTNHCIYNEKYKKEQQQQQKKYLNLKAWLKYLILFKYLAIYLKKYYNEITQLSHTLYFGQKNCIFICYKNPGIFMKGNKGYISCKSKQTFEWAPNSLLNAVFIFANTYCFMIYVCLWCELISQNFYKIDCFQKTFVKSFVLRLSFLICIHGKYICRLLHILTQSPFNTSERRLDYYHQQANCKFSHFLLSNLRD